jgi:methionyl-tRNA formyltransferase
LTVRKADAIGPAMRIVFMGAPAFAVPTLLEIIGQGHDVAAVYTRAPRPAGRRGLELTKTPVHLVADRHAIPVFAPATLRHEAEQAAFRAHEADVAVVVAYGLILPTPILAAPKLGCLNLHASLLPRWRGAAPIQRAIMAGDRESGVCVMRIEEGLDSGPVALVERVAISPTMTAGDLAERLARLGADMMARALPALDRDVLDFTPQAGEGVTYAKKIDKAEARIDWAADAETIRNQIHGLSPAPGAYAQIDFGRGAERIKILRARIAAGGGAPGDALDDSLTIACGRGAIQIVEAQRAGKTAMAGEALARGAQISRGARFI